MAEEGDVAARLTHGYVLGVDGCKSGWLAARHDLKDSSFAFAVYATFRDLLAFLENASAIAVDIPIGLTECCEIASVIGLPAA